MVSPPDHPSYVRCARWCQCGCESCLLPWMQPVLATSSTPTTLRSWLEYIACCPQLHHPLQSSPELLCLLVPAGLPSRRKP